jgi:hypothetical protein
LNTDADFADYRRARLDGMEADDVGSCKLPTQTQEGRARCFCGAEIDIASMDGHVTAAHMTETATLYSIATNQSAIAALFRVMNSYVGNLQPMPGVFPDYPAPVVRNAGAERELVLIRWGMPPPPKVGGPTITNIRNVPSELRAAGTLTKKST